MKLCNTKPLKKLTFKKNLDSIIHICTRFRGLKVEVLCGKSKLLMGVRGRDCMVVGVTTTYAISAYQAITTKVVSSNPAHGEV